MPHWRRNGTNICSMYQHDQFDLPNFFDQYQSLILWSSLTFLSLSEIQDISKPCHHIHVQLAASCQSGLIYTQTINRIVTLLYASLPKKNNNIIIRNAGNGRMRLNRTSTIWSDSYQSQDMTYVMQYRILSRVQLLIWDLTCRAIIMVH